ncbi:unnamed protein product [Symbiodinium sp. CCMP2592]|nr:unnamed protein product [Symbiodinium sp. CCMP2592]
MAAASRDDGPKLERFDGTQPATYRKWRRKAELMLMALPNTYSKEKWGAKLMEQLSGEAEEVCEAIPVEKLIKEGGHELVLKALDDKYKELDKDALHKHLTEYFYGVSIKGGETYRNLMVRLETSYRRLQEHTVELPEEVRGWFLLRKLGMDATAEAMVLTHTKGSLKYPQVSKAVNDIFPQGVAKGASSKVKEVFEVENVPENSGDTEYDDVDEVYQAVADQVQSNPEYDDEDALDVFETYKEVRKQVQQRKLGRGYKPHGQRPEWTLSGTVKGRIEQLKMKTKCHGCGERGHWKKECPKRKSASSGNAKEAMMADLSGGSARDLEQEFFIDEESIDQLEVFLAEQGDQVDVIVAPKCESINENDEVRGDFEQGLMKFFSIAHDSDARSSEAYMADLASHGDVSQKQAKTHEVNAAAMSYTGNESDVPMISEFVVRTPLVERLVADLAPQLQGAESATIATTILDAASDHSDDEPEGLVSGLSGDLLLNIGKYEKMKVAMKFSTAYINDKKYIAWVRKFIKDKESRNGKSECHPTMGLFRLYIELRDQVKSRRLRSAAPSTQRAVREATSGYGSSDQAPLVPATTPLLQLRAKAKSQARPSSSAASAWPATVSAEPEASMDANQLRRMQIQQRIEALSNELEALNEMLDL